MVIISICCSCRTRKNVTYDTLLVGFFEFLREISLLYLRTLPVLCAGCSRCRSVVWRNSNFPAQGLSRFQLAAKNGLRFTIYAYKETHLTPFRRSGKWCFAICALCTNLYVRWKPDDAIASSDVWYQVIPPY